MNDAGATSAGRLGRGGEARTPDIRFWRAALCQLSYAPARCDQAYRSPELTVHVHDVPSKEWSGRLDSNERYSASRTRRADQTAPRPDEGKLAERVGFGPTRSSHPYPFSRRTHSTRLCDLSAKSWEQMIGAPARGRTGKALRPQPSRDCASTRFRHRRTKGTRNEGVGARDGSRTHMPFRAYAPQAQAYTRFRHPSTKGTRTSVV